MIGQVIHVTPVSKEQLQVMAVSLSVTSAASAADFENVQSLNSFRCSQIEANCNATQCIKLAFCRNSVQGRAEQGRETATKTFKTLIFGTSDFSLVGAKRWVHGNEGLLEPENRPIQKSKYFAQNYSDAAADSIAPRQSVCRCPVFLRIREGASFVGRPKLPKNTIFRLA